MSEQYAWYKEHGICVLCGQKDAQKGYTRCLECRFKEREYARKSREKLTDEQKAEYNDKKRKAQSNLYQRRKEQGICVMCGKAKADRGVRCSVCQNIVNRHKKEKSREQGTMPIELFRYPEYCSTCGRPVMQGKRVCERCYENILKMGEKGRQAMALKKQSWTHSWAVRHVY